MIPIAKPFVGAEEKEAVVRVLESGMLAQGENVKEFEKAFAAYCGVRFAVATNSCSAALEISLRSLGLKQDDEVIVPIETFFSTGASVLREGGKISFAGIDPQTFCLSLNEIKKVFTTKTKAIILVHMAGLVTPEVEDIADFCRQKGIALIEDAAHAPGASFNGKKSGSFGNMACFSFYPTKIMTTGEGGMIVTNDEGLYQQANSYRHRGRDMAAPEECYRYLGTNNRMTEIQAILGLVFFQAEDGIRDIGVTGVQTCALPI